MAIASSDSVYCDVRLSIIPAGAVTDPLIEPRDLQVLALLGRHTNRQGWCFRSQVKMAEELRCGRATVQRSLDRLYQAGWVERRLRSRMSVAADPAHPHTAHAYRVKLDREVPDEIIFSDDDGGPEEGGCPSVGTPPDAADQAGMVPADGQGVPTQDGQGGAHTYVGTHVNDDSEGNDSNGERDARARDDRIGVKKFKAVWPTANTDAHGPIEREWAGLSVDDQRAAIEGVERFLTALAGNGRKRVPSGATYLRERKWVGLPDRQAKPEFVTFDPWSREWWAWFLARIDRGDPVRVALEMAKQQVVRRRCEKVSAMPPDDVIIALKPFPSDGYVLGAWRPWFAERGLHLPQWRERIWVFLPGPEPPATGQPALGMTRATGPPQAAE